MKSRSLRTATLFALLMLAEPISPRPGAQEAKPKQGETRLSCVVVLHIGMQRKQVRPMILYADEYGWNRRSKVLRPEQMQDLLSESCDVRTLDKLFSTAVPIEGWITQGEYGNTEFTFIRSDGMLRSLILDRERATIAFQALQHEVRTNSIVWKYLTLINKTWPTAASEPLPPDLPRSR